MSIRISNSPTKYFGHILRHPRSLEYSIMFNSSGSLRTVSSPFRHGAPRAHSPEFALAESQREVLLHRYIPPRPSNSLNPFHSLLSIPDLKQLRGTSLRQSYSTTDQLRLLLPLAHARGSWKFLPKKLIQSPGWVFSLPYGIQWNWIALRKKMPKNQPVITF